jgi:hypothetical protein
MTWAIPLVVALSARARLKIGFVLVFVLALTQLYLRGYYDALVDQNAPGVLTLLTRQAAIALLAWLVARGAMGREPAGMRSLL